MGSKYEIHSFGLSDRSARIRWLLAEFGISVAQEHELDWDAGDLDKPDYLALNPMGMSPTMIEDGKAVWESVACCLYLADKYSSIQPLAPPISSPLRAQYLQWSFFIAATVDPKFNELMYLVFGEDQERIKKEQPVLTEELQYMARILERELGSRDYLVGGEFTAADIPASLVANYMLGRKVIAADAFPRLLAYIERLKKRPAAQKVKAFGA